MENETKQIYLLNSSQGQPSGLLQELGEIPATVALQVNLENVEDFSSVCRTCATITELVIPIFSGEGLQNNLADKINKHLPIHVSEQDELPQAVCYQCVHTLLAWHELVKCCEQADAALHTRHQQLQPRREEQMMNEERNAKDNKSQEKITRDGLTKIEVEITEATGSINTPKVANALDSEKKYVECEHCKKNVLVGNWHRHIRSHYGEKRYSCSAQDTTFHLHVPTTVYAKQAPFNAQKTILQDHITTHPETNVCEKASETSFVFKSQNENGVKNECTECGEKFNTLLESRTHAYYQHTMKEAKHTEILGKRTTIEKPKEIFTLDSGKKYGRCPYCNKTVSLATWNRHIRSHHGEVRYSCDFCGFGFADSGHFRRHVRAVHAKERPHSCHICQKTFSRKANLEDHVKTHSDKREFVCDVCGKASKSRPALRAHIRIHNSSCNFDCMECGSKFKSRKELLAHLTVHTGERAHGCTECGKRFRLRSQLNAHLKIHKLPEDNNL